ncbi:MAG: CHAT domain-containing protein [Sedimentisphaerales bacterium]|nr:CHAT domain-containing protein [Sedimentisphaerales bacterium]
MCAHVLGIEIQHINDKYVLRIDFPDGMDTREENLPISRRTQESRLFTLRENLNGIVRKFSSRVSLTKSEKREILETLSVEGYDAYADWVGMVGTPARDLLDWALDSYPDLNTIRVRSKEFFFPWEIVNNDTAPMWGLSYIIQRQIPQNGIPSTPRTQRLVLSDPPKVGLLALKDEANMPSVYKEEIPYFFGLAKESRITCTMMEALDPSADKRQEMTKLRNFAGKKRNFYHIACHIESDYNPARSKIVITNWFRVSPDDLRRERVVFRDAPFLVLNACGTAKLDPFHTSDLVMNLMDNEIVGILATQCQVPDVFASEFVKKFYAFLLDEQEVGLALKWSQEFFLEEHNNPFGLLYSLYQVSPIWKVVQREMPSIEFVGG